MIKFVFGLLAIMGISGQLAGQQSDNENGTYTNPVIWSDFPDNDVIRVGDTYYMVTTSMYFFPGVPVMKSKDLVNWQYGSNAITRFEQHPAYNMNGATRYGHGQWASSLRYHNGKFYILFVTLDEGGFLLTATNPDGPWKLQKLPKAYYDAGLFFDDNNKIYIVHGYSKLSLTEVNDSLAPLGRDSIIFDKVQRKGLEGSHVYKINGYYYIYATYGGGDGYQACLRSKNIYGPYEEKIVLKDDMNLAGKGVHQGALVETQTGQWWSVIFQDRDGVGRVPTLQPVHWTDGWPIVGENGRAVVTAAKPDVGKHWPVAVLPTSDEFSNSTLGLQWAWNHNPNDSCWSLTKRKGYLHLQTSGITHDLTLARNTLTQRIFGPYSNAVIALETDGMKTGDVAGLAVLQLPYASIAVKAGSQGKSVVMAKNGITSDSIFIGSLQQVYLKAAVNTTRDIASFSYSTDNKNFIPLGDTLHLQFNLKMFTGNRFAIFNYAGLETGGFADCNWFRMETRKGPPNLFKANTRIEAEMYDHINLAKTVVSKDSAAGKEQDIAQTVNGSWLQFDRVDFGKGFPQMLLRCAGLAGGTMNVFLDKQLTIPYCTVVLPAGNGTPAYKTIAVAVKPVTGIHQLTIKFEGSNEPAATMNWFSFK